VPGAVPETLLAAALLVPLGAALLIPFCDRYPNLRETVSIAAAAALALLVWLLLPAILAGDRPRFTATEILPGIRLAFAVEPLGMLFALVAGSLWLVNSIYSIGYMRANNEPRQTAFYACFAVAIAATMGVAFAENLFTLFLCYELLTLSTYPLVTHKANPEAMRAGRTYLGLLIGTSMVLLLPAIIITGVVAGTLDFTPGGILSGKTSAWGLGLLLALFVFGIGKAALMPLHFWLPAAMVAPTPVSALLHAVAVVKAGVFTVVKVIIYVFGIGTLAQSGTGDWLTWAAGATIIVASVIALRQDNLKKRLAYSTVSQLSYVVLAAALYMPSAAIGAAMHIAAHAVSKITLFFAAGAIYTAAHKTEISDLDGIGRRMPWTMTAFAIGALAMIGVPPTAGFLGKWFILQGAIQDVNWLAVGIIIASTALNAAYFLPIVFRAFLKAPATRNPIWAAAHPELVAEHGEAPWPMVMALSATALATLLLFLFPDVPLSLAGMMIER
jgi:multicomponent Na+:H+ antiporter subunit D